MSMHKISITFYIIAILFIRVSPISRYYIQNFIPTLFRISERCFIGIQHFGGWELSAEDYTVQSNNARQHPIQISNVTFTRGQYYKPRTDIILPFMDVLTVRNRQREYCGIYALVVPTQGAINQFNNAIRSLSDAITRQRGQKPLNESDPTRRKHGFMYTPGISYVIMFVYHSTEKSFGILQTYENNMWKWITGQTYAVIPIAHMMKVMVPEY